MKKLIKKIVVITLVAFMGFNFLGFSVNAEGMMGIYSKIINKNSKSMIKIGQPDEITTKMLINRKNKYVVIEVCVGKVTNNKKDGRILNTKSKYNYISYKRVKGVKKGNKIITVLVYNNNDYEDDIIFRIDKKIK